MAKKKRPAAPSEGVPGNAARRSTPAPAASAREPSAAAAAVSPLAPPALPAEVVRGNATVAIFALVMLLAPGLGVPSEEMLQDTLKSMVVSLGAVLAAVLFFWQQRARREPLRWHAIVWLPIALMVYALFSMAWSHTYLAGGEAIRWFVFALLLWLGLNSLDRERAPWLAWGIHGGAVLASLWAALQFWFDLKLFPQGPNPASTFVNRNFFAEFAVCTLPFSAWLLMRSRSSARIALLAFSIGFNITAIFMTGTRSALLALLALAIVLPVAFWRCRGQLPLILGPLPLRLLAAGVLLATVAGLGVIPSGNAAVLHESQSEGRGSTALERGFVRTLSMAKQKEYSEGSFSVRWVMWSATMRMVRAHPLAGVGAGAWEIDIPLYQEEDAQLETDYYAHNEPLQLLAEYGLVGWLFLVGLLAYLAQAAWRTWRLASPAPLPERSAELPLRSVALCSLMVLLVVSNAGFPWRMASTGALFALSLALLAASDARLGLSGRWQAAALRWQPRLSQLSLGASAAALVLALYISDRAAECERYIVRAVRMALSIAGDAQPNHPRWAPVKTEMLALLDRGIAINPHYRKLTPMAADSMAGWGDWKNAIRIWDSVAQSRPYVAAILGNIARGYINLRDDEHAKLYVDRIRQLQPHAPAVQALDILLLQHSGRREEAIALIKDSFRRDVYDYDIAMAAYVFGLESGDPALAVEGLERAAKAFPQRAADAWLKAARLYASPQLHDETKALAAFRAALDAVPAPERPAVLHQIPAYYLGKL